MINVICVKWGTKYSADHVNRLYRMVSKYLYRSFMFYCYTDDPTGVQGKIIPIEDDLEIYWNKLSMFKQGFVPEGPCIFFDLDVVIQNPITDIFQYLDDGKLTMVKSYWKREFTSDGSSPRPKERWDMYANSSVLLWNSDSLTHIWDHFNSDPEYYMIQYHGIDRFLFHEKMPIKFLPKGIVYSRIFGITEEDYERGIDNRKNIKKGLPSNPFYEPELPICIFNGPKDDSLYEGYEKYYSSSS